MVNDYDISIVKGIGKKIKEKLNEKNIYNVVDLLYYFPKKYDIFEENPNLLRSEEYTVIKGNLDSNPVFIKKRRNSYSIIFYFNCYGNRIKCITFGADYLKYKLHKGINCALYGRYNSIYKEFLVTKIFLTDFETKIECDYKINGVNNVIACIVMDDTSKVFSDSSIVFQGYSPELKEQAKRMCEYYGDRILSNEDKKSGATPLGYGDCGYLLGAYYNTPNNTLPIIWSEENLWYPIFKRYNKKYVSDNKIRLGGQYV